MKHLLYLCYSVMIAAVTCFGGDSMLVKGATAPQFELKTADGVAVKLSDFRDKKFVVLIFYPGDETPVCTRQLCEIRDDYSSFEKRGAVVFGVNPGSDKSHNKFSRKNGFQFPLLVDVKSSVAERYLAKGAVMNKRTVYVVGKDGTIVFARRGKPPVAEILAAIPENPAGDTIPSVPKLKLKTE